MKPIDSICIEKLSKILGELTTGSKITKLFNKHKMIDHDTQAGRPILSTKWKRLNASINQEYRDHSSDQPLFIVIEDIMNPVNYINETNTVWYDNREKINRILIFYGYELNDRGNIQQVKAAESFTEAKKRCDYLKERLDYFTIHEDVLRYCRPELLQNNYFHAIFEASKGVLDRLRMMTTSTKDGNSLVNEAFNLKSLSIIIKDNNLESQNDRNEYFGLKSLLNTICYTYRNPRAHSPKLYNDSSERDAITAFIIMSLAHTQLDNCTCIRYID
ncbi:TIGR02391 family protein [Sporolactobacillus sp. STCC-11]|uniref:TIGR02391 family protein n=1 Tax=Sporolactobacillus caesalpiniae TaxID=3230362 RepID=UPI0033925322